MTKEFVIRYLWYDERDGRWQRGEYGLHCGDGVEVRIGGEWHQTRIEHTHSSTHSNGWYLVSHPDTPLDGLAVRKELR